MIRGKAEAIGDTTIYEWPVAQTRGFRVAAIAESLPPAYSGHTKIGDAAMQDAPQNRQLLAESEVETMLARLHALGGADPPFVNECLQLWREQMASDLAEVQVAVAQADAEAAARCAHSMMGSCLTVGASQLRALAAHLEAQARSGTLTSMETERRGLVELYERVCVLLWPAANKR